MATRNLSKPASNRQLKEVSKQKPEDRQVPLAGPLGLIARDMQQMAAHLEDVSRLLYERQDEAGEAPKAVMAAQLLLDGFSEELDKLAGYVKDVGQKSAA